jgi:hypothetical protein
MNAQMWDGAPEVPSDENFATRNFRGFRPLTGWNGSESDQRAPSKESRTRLNFVTFEGTKHSIDLFKYTRPATFCPLKSQKMLYGVKSDSKANSRKTE